MKFILFLAVSILFNTLSGTEIQQKINPEVFDTVINEIAKFHYDTDFRQKYAQLINTYRQKSVNAANNSQLGRILNEFLRQLPESHLAVLPPPEKNPIAPLENNITLIESNNKVLVYDIAGDSGAEKILEKGDEIISVGNFTADPNARIGKAVQLKNKFAYGIPGKKTQVEFIRSGRKITKTFTDVKIKKYPKFFKLGEMPPFPEFYESKMLNKNTGFIRFDFFTPASLTKLRDDIKNKFSNTPRLIIDLRHNMGGLIMLGVNMASFLHHERVDFGTMTIANQKLTPKSYPQKDRYKGKIYILIGRNSYSTAEIFAQAMREANAAALLGETTSGMCLPSAVITLPHKFRLQTIVGDYSSAKGIRIEGKGVTPDRIIKISAADLRSGRDPVIAAAITDL